MIRSVYKGEIVFARLLLPAVLGIALAIVYPNGGLSKIIIVLGLVSSFILLTLWIRYKQFKVYFFKWWPGLFVKLLLLSLFYIITRQHSGVYDLHFSKLQAEALLASVDSEPKATGDVLRFEAEISQVLIGDHFQKSSGRLLIALKVDSTQKFSLRYGSTILIPYKLALIDPPFNPNEFDFRQYLSFHGIYHQAFINSKEIKVLEKEDRGSLVGFALNLRRKMVEGFNLFIPGKNAAALASTLILGYRADLSPELLNAYSQTGTMHVLSVSGMHVALVLVILTRMLSFMDRSKELKVLKAILIISLISFYALITGFSPSVCRAALMISLLFIGKLRNRRANSYNIIAASAFLLLIWNPYFLVDAGFQLSYLAVLGLIYLYPKIYHLFYCRNYLLDKAWDYTALSLAAQFATAPLSIFYFHQFPVYFLVSNLFIVVPISLIMYAGLALLALYSFSGCFPLLISILNPLGWTIGKATDIVNSGLFYIENLPLASLSFYHYGALYYLTMFTLLLFLTVGIQFRKKKFIYVSLGLLFLVVSYTSYSVIQRRHQKTITFYSLRKQSAISILNGDHAYLISDRGNNPKTYSFSVKPHLTAWANTIESLHAPRKSRQMFYDGNFFQYQNYKVLIWDQKMNTFGYTYPIKVNVVLLSGNPRIRLSEMVKSVTFDQLLIDGSNTDFRIRQWLAETKELGVSCYVLKRNPAYIVSLRDSSKAVRF